MGIAVVALVGGIATSIQASDIHRKQAKAGVVRAGLRRGGGEERGQLSVRLHRVHREQHAGRHYRATSRSAGRYQPFLVDTRSWRSGTATTSTYTTCPATGDAGVQRVTLRIYTPDGRASEKIDIVVRKPCRPPVDPPLVVSAYPGHDRR